MNQVGPGPTSMEWVGAGLVFDESVRVNIIVVKHVLYLFYSRGKIHVFYFGNAINTLNVYYTYFIIFIKYAYFIVFYY